MSNKLLKKICKQQKSSWVTTTNVSVSKNLNIYANAVNSCLCLSPIGPFPSVNLPSRLLNLEGFSWQKGFRNPLSSVSITKTYGKFLEAIFLIARVLEKGGQIYVVFDGDELRPPSSFLNLQKSSSVNKTKHVLKNPQRFWFYNRAVVDLKRQNFSTTLSKNKTKCEKISWSGEKWVGGTFSNLKQVSKSTNLYKTLSRQFLEILENQTSSRYLLMAKKFHGNLYCSKKKGSINQQHEKQEANPMQNESQSPGIYAPQRSFASHAVQGTKSSEQQELLSIKKQDSESKNKVQGFFLKKKKINPKNSPDLIIVENAEKYKNVVAEAETLKIPLIAFVESDNFSNVSIALPLNALKHPFLAFLLYINYKLAND